MAEGLSPIPLLDLEGVHRDIRHEIDAAIDEVVNRGWFVLGREVESFEVEFAEEFGSSFAVGVASGLDALTLTLQALDVGPGDEVLVPSNTFVATWLAVSAVGATPVPVEPDPTTHLIDVDRAAQSLSPRTSAIMPVHLYGQPVDVGGFERLAGKHGLALVFDAAQAAGARVAGRPIGGAGTASAWSFYPSKNLGCLGDGGAVTTNDRRLAERLRCLRDYGRATRFDVVEQGRNSRLDEIQAAVLRVKMAHLDRWNERRRLIAAAYSEALLTADIEPPIEVNGRVSAWHLYVVKTSQRAHLRRHLASLGIETQIHYPIPPHRQGVYASRSFPRLPIADSLAARVLSLPIGPHVTDSAVERVCTALNQL
jgi:dTDP-4-amino-4,6-dideoxygalactose transaminase